LSKTADNLFVMTAMEALTRPASDKVKALGQDVRNRKQRW
jgi:hypothetical protein